MNSKRRRSDQFAVKDLLSTTRSELMASPPLSRWTVLVCALAVTCLVQGCRTVGPRLYQGNFNDYTDAISKTSDGQMLANLVRMRYLESPIFLQVSSVSTSFNVSGNVGASAGLNPGRADDYGLSAGGSISESPTITFSMPDSEKYYGRLLAPLSAKQVTSLVLAGFDSELVFGTAVRGVNGLRNLNASFENSPKERSDAARFSEVFALIKKLRAERIVDLELGGKETFWSSPMKVNATGEIAQVLLLGAASYAMSNDAEIVGYPDGTWQTHKYEKHMALRFSPASDDSPDARRLKELLALKADHYNFSFVEAEMVNAEKPRGVLGQSPGALDPSVIWVEIGVRGRSMLEIMQVAAKQVRVPEDDIRLGTASASQSQDANGASASSDWLVIKSSAAKPNSSLRVNHRGSWFYIDDTDLQSRESFAMINALFAVVGGTVPGAQPVMTIPVGL
jgi:hypothetical protein